MNPYRTPTEPPFEEPKTRSFLCRIGLHKWELLEVEYSHFEDDQCPEHGRGCQVECKRCGVHGVAICLEH